MGEEQIRGSRWRRAATMTGTAAGIAAREATARVIRAGGGDERASKQQLKSAESLVKVLGSMRGAAMKVGQTLSAVDLGLVPEEIRPQFQEILAALQQDAEPMSFKAIRKVIEDDFGEPLGRAFADFDEEPLAAASIGQVHRAVLSDGRAVAVKVQYPGIGEAIRADMQNLRLALKLLGVIAPGIDTGPIAEEIRERIGQELDYELEASNQRATARIYSNPAHPHPFIFVPGVVSELCRERVLVTELVEAKRFAAAREAPGPERDRYGEILIRFYINGPLRHRLLNGDPHPGNSLFFDDGRVAFLDFGFFKTLSDEEVSQLIASTRATYEHDAQALFEVIAPLGGLPPDPALAEPFLESYDAIFGWLLRDHVVTVDGSATGAMMRSYNKLRNSDQFKSLILPAEHFVMMRAVMLLIGLLGQLGATGNWLDLAREWVLGEEPGTELGRLEAEFFVNRPYPPTVPTRT